MPLPTPPLDDRSFQDLVDEAKRRIPLYCPEWTDHNVSDPGVTLIELFAWMVDILLYRVNQLPLSNHVALLNLLGIQLEPPRAASVPLTFYLSAPQDQTITIPRGTATATSRAGGGEAVVFTTEHDLAIRPARLEHIVTRYREADGNVAYHDIPLARLSSEFAVFSPTRPQEGDALYLGHDVNLDNHYIGLEMNAVRAGGLNIIPESPPIVWQAWTADGWRDTDVELDATGGMSFSGQIRMHLPVMARSEINGVDAYWLRCQVTPPREDQRPYTTSPILRRIEMVTWGGTVLASHATEAANEPVGRSDGSPGQVFHLEHTPVLPRHEDERVEVWTPGMADWEPWIEVESLAESGADDRHYTLDSASGEVRFGPALRQRDGTVLRYGALPPRGAEIRFSRYRYGGGTNGNVRAGSLTEPRAALAYVSRTSNRSAAQGGLDQESLEQAMFRARHLLRSRYRAVTPDDYEFLTLDAFRGEVARVCCLQTTAGAATSDRSAAGQVYVLVIPQLPDEEAQRYIPLPRLALGAALQARITDFLNERRLLTTLLEVRSPAYKRVRVDAVVVARPEVDERRVTADIRAALERFINPLRGGAEGTGWPFGREIYLSDLYSCIQKVDGLLNVQNIDLYWIDEEDRAHQADRKIDLLAHEVVVSDIHNIEITAE
ncbi:MAG: putative baseplate assembly protein [Chloroflexi bacterium]|nr:putative baseplate assembly protein [Chloroflexota bacterium]